MASRNDVINYLTKKLSPFCDDSCVIDLLYSKQLENLQDIFSRCVRHSESNSLLVMGPRGAGKTVLVNTALRWLENQNDSKGNYTVVKLHGCVHTDDRAALKDITRQLHLENVIGDRVFGSFAENLQFLLDSLKSGIDRSKAKSSIFILEDFERFTQHKNQTLLYNLFDVAQSRQAPVAVVGICSRLDTVELLEKRVKSRFAHRFIHMMNSVSESDYLSIADKLLSIEADSLDKKIALKWNNRLAKLMPSLKDSLLKLYSLDCIVRTLANTLQLMIRQIDDDLRLDPIIFRDCVNRLYDQDPKLTVTSRMPALQVILLVCMLRLNAIYDGEPFNFELLHKEYLRFVHTTKSSLNLSKNIIFKAFEGICDLELAQSIGGSLETQKRYRLHHLHFCKETIREAVKLNGNLPTDVSQWVSSTLSDRSLGI